MVAKSSWKDLRMIFVKQNNSMCKSAPPIEFPYYHPIDSQFSSIGDLNTQEQERLIELDLRTLLLGDQTEHIRLNLDKAPFPTSLVINGTIDPYIREIIDNFSKPALNLYTIRKCCHEIVNDRVHFTATARLAARSIHDSTRFIIQKILKPDKQDAMDSGINELNRAVTKANDIFHQYASVTKEIYTKKLIGGQVLSCIHDATSVLVDEDTKNALFNIYKNVWAHYARHISTWVNKGVTDDADYEFFVWPTKGLDNSHISILVSNYPKNITVNSPKFAVVAELCPSFFVRLLPLILKCGDFRCFQNDVSNKMLFDREAALSEEDEAEKEMLLESLQLDTHSMTRNLERIDQLQSIRLLRQLRAGVDLDAALRDIHQLIYGLTVINELIVFCKKEYSSLIFQPIEQNKKRTIERISNRILHGRLQEDYYPFWKYFNFDLAYDNLMLSLCDKNICSGGAPDPNQLEGNMFYNSLTLVFSPPSELERVIPSEIISECSLIFRFYLQLAWALSMLADRMFELRHPLPSHRGYSREEAQQRHVTNTMFSLLQMCQQKLTQAIKVALAQFPNQATTIEQIIHAQRDIPYFIMKFSGLHEWKRMEPVYELIKLSFFCTSGEEMLKVLPDLQSRVDEILEQFMSGV
ncbi:hypothetical protein WR25_11019 [Diploscapter pachys]|uniref:Gamma-tubulin complex component n=1 Tax=Diploscapter pachys TaxID=2018661 RepID=A0A2A2K2M7_9BILA|nr:hypothetical protein WR25_11019 [Diploscapter pachys]